MTTTEHKTGTREEWLAARKVLLVREKELTRRSDELARERQELPWVPVEKPYVFETEAGARTLGELFDGRSQLLTYHFMFGAKDAAPCLGCSFTADSLDGAVVHLAHHDVTFVAVSRAPVERIAAYKRRMGWGFEWVSSFGSDFSVDFDERLTGIDLPVEEVHGLSAFALEDGVVHHTYSCYDRGTDVLNATWQLLDRAPMGRAGQPEHWPRRHDEYDA